MKRSIHLPVLRGSSGSANRPGSVTLGASLKGPDWLRRWQRSLWRCTAARSGWRVRYAKATGFTLRYRSLNSFLSGFGAQRGHDFAREKVERFLAGLAGNPRHRESADEVFES
jgi:hypothetical protein